MPSFVFRAFGGHAPHHELHIQCVELCGCETVCSLHMHGVQEPCIFTSHLYVCCVSLSSKGNESETVSPLPDARGHSERLGSTSASAKLRKHAAHASLGDMSSIEVQGMRCAGGYEGVCHVSLAGHGVSLHS